MTRTLLAALIAACGLTSAAQAQTYYHAPAYSAYGYTTSYGPLGIFGPRAWFGRPVAYTSPYYGSTSYAAAYSPSYAYTTAYSPSYGYTAAYSPAYTYTASYSPVVTTSYYSSAVASACCAPACCTPCCASCSPCSTCASGTCPGGNCSLNYAPSAALRPEPDPASSGSSGTKTFQNESNGTRGDNFGPARDRSGDGFEEEDGEYGAGYRPEQKIEKRHPDTTADEAAEAVEAEAPAAGDSTPPDNATEGDTNDATDSDANSGLGAPDMDDQPEAVLPALNLDTRIVAAPSLLRERTRLKARFGSPQLARAYVDPATLPAAVDVRLVRN